MSMGASAQDASFDDYVVKMQTLAREKGYSEETIANAFSNVELYESAISSDRNQPERRLTLDEYLARALPQWKVNQARSLYNKYYDVLQPISEEYGVPGEIIIALWGVESNFGKFTGNYDVISALTTMSYEGRREEFFQNQLWDALTILERGDITRGEMKGSWAGAMGQSQFMPSSYLAYAADGDGDGKADIWNNPADVFASAAKYLSTVGWREGYRWGRRVAVSQPLGEELIGIQKELQQPLQAWADLGVTMPNGTDLPVADIPAWLIEPEPGRFYLIYENYQTLLDWNRSHHFVFSVVGLAERIRR
uniref:lytic murein transglycosylase n=1 Tax=Thaumasiovibrio occultus TaxID=1891184 RepID=UPI000B3566F4|nr:lytic murein transglycosylase [Thaumasiovibrio occultus]